MYNNNYTTMQKVDKILDEVGLSSSEGAVYLAMLEGAERVKEIMRISGEKRPTVYYCLNSLKDLGLVSSTGKEYGNKFQLEPPEKLIDIVRGRLQKQKKLLEDIESFSLSFLKKQKESNVNVSYFDTLQSIKSAILYTLYTKQKTIKSIVPACNFFEDMGSEFIKKYVEDKNKKCIKTEAIWEKIPTKKILDIYYKNSEIREFPGCMKNSFEMTVFIYDDKVLYVASKKELYAMLVKSKEHTKFMEAMFRQVWKNSKRVK